MFYILYAVLFIAFYYLASRSEVIPAGRICYEEGDVILIAGCKCKVLRINRKEGSIKVRRALLWEK